jgi:hypothetical protein
MYGRYCLGVMIDPPHESAFTVVADLLYYVKKHIEILSDEIGWTQDVYWNNIIDVVRNTKPGMIGFDVMVCWPSLQPVCDNKVNVGPNNEG